MRRIFSKALCVLFFAFVCICTVPAFAQSATTGAIGGTIYDPAGSVLAGVEITALNAATGEIRTTVTKTSGEYRITDLTPGTYTVTVTAQGFQTYKAVQVPVAVGTVSDIAPKLTVGNVSETVEVTDETPLMHTQSSEISSVVDQNMIDNLPINGRRYSNFALLTPGVIVGDPDGLGLLSFRGVNYLLNNSTVDGMDDNQAYFSEQRGRTTVSYSFALAAVQEFQVNTSNYSAEYGRAAGGVTNTVTKSGGNKVHGELYFFDRDNALGSTNPYTNVTTEQPAGSGNYVTNVVKPKDWRKSWGFGIGGPIIHDKLFFFYAYDQQRKNYPGISRFTQNAINNGVFAKAYLSSASNCTQSAGVSTGAYSYTDSNGHVQNLTSASGQPQSQGPDSGGFAACQVAAALNVSYAAGVAYYSQGLAIIQSFTGQVPRRSDQMNNFPRLDWQINDKNRLTLEYSRFRSSGFSNYQSASSVNYGNHSFGDSYVKTDFGIMRLATVVSQSLVNEFRFQYGRDFEYQLSSPPGPNEASLASRPPGNPSDPAGLPLTRIGYYYDSSNYFRIGKNSGFDATANPNERRIQGEDIITWSHGRHITKAGIDINRVFDYSSQLYDESGDYRFPYAWNFIADYLHASTGVGPAKAHYSSFLQGFGNPSMNIATTDYAGFITDDWRILPNLTLTLGLRYEYERIPPNPAPMTAATLIPGTTTRVRDEILAVANVTPDDRNNIQPRVGFNWNVYGNGKTHLRGGFGIYSGRIINSAITSAYNQQLGPGSQQHLNASACNSNGYNYLWPNLVPDLTTFAAACGGFGPTINYFGKNFQNPQVLETDLALEQNLGWNTVFAVMYMSSLGRHLEGAFDQNNSCAGDFFNGTPCANNPHSYTVINADGVTPAPNNYVTYPHGGKPSPLAAKGYQTGSTLRVDNFYTSAQRFDGNYDGLAKINSSLNSSYNALAVQLNKRMGQGVSFNMNYTWAHSLDYNPYIGNDIPFGGPYDPTSIKDEYGNGQLDVRQRFVGSAVFRPKTNFRGWLNYVGNGWQLSPLVQIQTGLPYTPVTTGANPTGGYGQGSNGSGGVSASAGGLSRLLILGRNQSYLPKTTVVDLRLSKRFYFNPGSRRISLDLQASLYNALNHQNITRVSQTAYCLANSSGGTASASNQNCPGNITTAYGTPSGTNNFLIAQPNYGTYVNANSTLFQLTTRQVELSGRLYF
ncbi:MAG TPA: carboxypeptidase-like regulatory domain-containing protein [Acidobacteriaceae bacterium]